MLPPFSSVIGTFGFICTLKFPCVICMRNLIIQAMTVRVNAHIIAISYESFYSAIIGKQNRNACGKVNVKIKRVACFSACRE